MSSTLQRFVPGILSDRSCNTRLVMVSGCCSTSLYIPVESSRLQQAKAAATAYRPQARVTCLRSTDHVARDRLVGVQICGVDLQCFRVSVVTQNGRNLRDGVVG